MSNVELVSKYVQARQAGRNDEVLGYVADNITLNSAKDGEHSGKDAFSAYLSKVPPTGTWEAPVEEGGKVVVKGKVKYLLMNWDVISEFTVSGDKITHIEIKRA
eukprot:TRINITY_DN254_c0_g1_i1.p1 TRINITY_DN254_c0_g1~~TRINITY_DN254_c0_g1_i1.p1  ORF type:complete len:116 (-),score=34.98 TRINITY_DN254_c0_g1_i1:55-366(-)